ncbi:MAG: peptide/nickel transport system permease protein [Acidimicrobiaceae bacterium]|jgi:peptide/nickel transport system permease protein|nr:peptide/nickel transport system permease protein [Acidimicrobiaceae bacterium]
MARRLLSRAARLVVVFFAATLGCFLLLSRLPGDACIAQLGFNAAVPGLLEKCRHAYGLDQSLLRQYGNWLGHMVRLDLGTDPISHQPLSVLIGMRLERSLELVVVTLAISLVIGVLMGTVMAYRQGSRLDRVLSGLCMSFLSIPVFVTAVLLLVVFVAHLGWFPASGLPPWRVDPVRHITSLVLPATTLVLTQLPVIARVVRADMITTLQEDFITAARARGASDARILVRHVLRPSSFTLITMAGLQAGELVSGLVIVERFFNLNGLGSMFYGAITARSGFLLMTLVTYMALFWVGLNMVIDLLYAWLDPRLRRRSIT